MTSALAVSVTIGCSVGAILTTRPDRPAADDASQHTLRTTAPVDSQNVPSASADVISKEESAVSRVDEQLPKRRATLELTRAGRKAEDMPPFSAHRPDVRAIRTTQLENRMLDASECDAHRRAIPVHAKALDLVAIHPPPADSPMLLCIIYTYQKHHEAASVAVKTWLPRCDGALVLSNADDPLSFAVAVPHEGPEEYDNIWQKTRANWRFVSEYFLNDFDFFIFGGDDLFVIPANLKSYLASSKIAIADQNNEPLFLGRRFKQNGNWDRLFNSGGAGYVLNRSALKLLYDNFDRPFCRPHLRGFYEDVMVAKCLKEASNGAVLPLDTRDDEGRERFHPCVPSV